MTTPPPPGWSTEAHAARQAYVYGQGDQRGQHTWEEVVEAVRDVIEQQHAEALTRAYREGITEGWRRAGERAQQVVDDMHQHRGQATGATP